MREKLTTMGHQLRRFLDVAAGEGYVFDGIDAADLYIAFFGDGVTPAKIRELDSASQPGGGEADGKDWTNGGQYEAAIQNPAYFQDEHPTRRSKRYGPYDVAWMGAGVWAGLPDELPPELIGKKVWVAEIGHNHGKKLQRDGTLRAAPSAGNGGAEGG